VITLNQVARVLRVAADACDEIAAEVGAERAEWIDQHRSPLGPRRHCRAVAARVADGSPNAAIIGRRQLLSQEALSEELARGAKPHSTKKPSVADELRAELRLVGGAK
jgi:hypothetical protein